MKKIELIALLLFAQTTFAKTIDMQVKVEWGKKQDIIEVIYDCSQDVTLSESNKAQLSCEFDDYQLKGELKMDGGEDDEVYHDMIFTLSKDEKKLAQSRIISIDGMMAHMTNTGEEGHFSVSFRPRLQN